MIRPEIEITGDGSPTLRHPVTGDAYHSVRGAVGESEHVFNREGFLCSESPHVRIFEAGFGSGLNAWLTAQAARREGRTVFYEAVERYPVDPQTARKLSYATDPLFRALHDAAWNVPVGIDERFTLKKVEAALEDYRFDTTFDLVYFDAFAPDTQPELWSKELFARLYACLAPGGTLVTYSAKGLVKENLRAAGFEVRRLPGALGKRHMVRAVKPERSDTGSED